MHLPGLFATLAVSALVRPAATIPWLSSQQDGPGRQGDYPSPSYSSISPSDLLQAGAQQRSALYQRALAELQELEAEPLCHRVAARLLVNNCHLLDGKDDATVHTDSGRQVRDFVDSYAASLAICDLERASFSIPTACALFREPTLSQIPLGDSTAQLHVSEAQIRACLAGLGESPSAWNTWVSYSHKAKLTRVMAKLADDVEAELQKRFATWDAVVQGTTAKLTVALSKADAVRQHLKSVESILANQLHSSLDEATASSKENAQSAEALKQLLAIMLKSALEANSEMAYVHEQSMERVVQGTSFELDQMSTAMQGAFASAISLQREIEHSQLQTAELTSRQEALEKGMVHLASITRTFMADMSDHTRLLGQARNMTNDMLDTLEATAAATSIIQVTRNIGLITLGEMVGVAITSYSHFRDNPRRFAMVPARRDTASEDDSASEDDEHDQHESPERQATIAAAEEVAAAAAAAATTRATRATRSKTAEANNAEARPTSLFGPLELEPAGGEPPQEQAEARESEPDLPQQLPQDAPGQEQEQEDAPGSELLWNLYSEGERANPRADSDDDEGNHGGINDTIQVDAPVGEPGPDAEVPPDSTEEPQQKRQRVMSPRRLRGRKQGQSLANVVESVTAAMAKAKSSTPTKTRAQEMRAKRAEKRRQKQKEVEEQQIHNEEEGDEVVGALEQQGQPGEKEQAGAEVAEEEVEEPLDPKVQRRLRRQRRVAAQPPAAANGGEGQEATTNDDNNNNDDENNNDEVEDNDAAGREIIYIEDAETAPRRGSRSTRTSLRRAAKRKRGQVQPTEETEEVVSDTEEEEEEEEELRGESTKVQEIILTTAGQPAASDLARQRSLPDWLKPEVDHGLSKSAPVSTKTVASMVALMSSVGWTGMHTWKMSLPRGNPDCFVQPTTEQGKELCRSLANLMYLYSKVPQPEALSLLDQSGQDHEQAQTDTSSLDLFLERLEEADAFLNAIDEAVDLICNRELNPVTAFASANNAASRKVSRLRALLAEDLLAFVIPLAVAVLEAAYALGGRTADEELDLRGIYVPRETVQLNRATWHTVSKAAIWLIKLEKALAYELGYRAERDILGRYRQLEDSDDDDDYYRSGNTRPGGGGSRTPRGRFGRRGRPPLNRSRYNGPLNRHGRPLLVDGEAMDAALYESTPGAKRRDRCRLKPLLNQLQDEICRARIDIERNNRSPQSSPVPSPVHSPVPALAAGNDGADDIAMDSDGESGWVPVEVAASQAPRSQAPQAEVSETPRHDRRPEITLPQRVPATQTTPARDGQRTDAEGQEDEDGVEDDGQDEALMTPAMEASRQLGLHAESVESVEGDEPAETQADGGGTNADNMHVLSRQPSPANAPRATQASQATPSRAQRPSQAARARPPAAASSPAHARSSPVQARMVQAAPGRAPANGVPAERGEAPPAAAGSTANAGIAVTPQPRAYTSAELKLILVRLKGKAPLDLVQLAADFGRDVYDVASRVEGVKNVVRATAVREKKPVPRWARAGYFIR
ncbi:hypothetical protein SCUCBS95973_002087 [Sporothrix curviconia]|uniref:Uncharacterized protein n=1 Tax=Sporothrix curviconia TaxID=1260050 RepID=A0ABP0B4L9_9PEZI